MKRLLVLTCLVMPVLCYTKVEPKVDYGLLVKQGEEVQFSFRLVHSKKTVVVCKGANSKYLVYRFGTSDKVELQYPAQLDTNSWKLFKYRGYTRGGGKENLARGEYTLEFTNKEISYKLHEDWNSEDDSYDIGIDVEGADMAQSLKGDPKTREGDMAFIGGDSDQLHNYMGEE